MNTNDKPYGTGRRKNAVARVILKPNGEGKYTINRLAHTEYIKRATKATAMLAPLQLITTPVDLNISVSGGGKSGQVDAIKMGIARAMLNLDSSLRESLAKAKYLTRDSRMVERKKPGHVKARKRQQFKKR